MTELDELIYERIAVNEVFILYKDTEGVLYIGNKDGNAFVEKIYWKEKEENK